MIARQYLSEEFIARLRRGIEEGEIITGRVQLTQNHEGLGTDIVLVEFEDHLGLILRDEMDYQVDWRNFVDFVGKDIIFKIKEIDEETGVVHLSRKDAQLAVLDGVIEGLKNGEHFEAEITGLLDYGAYVSINGIYALMRNVDYSDGYLRISEEHEKGDILEVKLRNISDNGRIAVQPIEKVKVESVMDSVTFEEEQVVVGVVRSVRTFGAFVGIAPGLDALCNLPATGEIEEGTKVQFKINRVFEEENEKTGEKELRVRGKILSIIGQ